MAAPAASPFYLRAWPAVGGHIGKLTLPDDIQARGHASAGAAAASSSSSASASASVPLFVLLDRSGSMGSNVGRLVNKVLPLFLDHIGHPAESPITVLAFDDKVEVLLQSRQQLLYSPLKARGGTNLTPAIGQLEKELMKLQAGKVGSNPVAVRILTLTDGELADQAQALQSAGQLRQLLTSHGFLINSQCVRIFTSSSQPDTRGLTGMMQLSNACPSSLIDIDMYKVPMESIAHMLAKEFQHDQMQHRITLQASKPVLHAMPWHAPGNAVMLVPGENVFFIASNGNVRLTPPRADEAADAPAAAPGGPVNVPPAPAGELVSFTLSGSASPVPVLVEMCPPLDAESYQELLHTKISSSTQQIKMLQVMGTAAARQEIESIVAYWTKLDASLSLPREEVQKLLAAKQGLMSRLAYFKAVSVAATRSASARMAQLANDDRVSQLNSAQAAEYLRSVDASSGGAAAKGLARRAVASVGGLSFDACAREEVRAIATHLHELADIDDSDHAVSFYSQETTLGGLRATASLLTEDGMLDTLTVSDILQLLNLVGVAVNAPIGDYPDAMSWSVNKCYGGTYLSLSDLLTSIIVSKGRGGDAAGSLEVPGQPGELITSVVPFFDDDRIATFLRRYAPRLLEYTASVNMRRVVAEVPMTHSYTLAAGAWSLLQSLSLSPSHRSELDLATVVKLARSFAVSVGGYFAHVSAHLVPGQPGQALSPPAAFSLGKNGVTNCLQPLMSLLQDPSKHGIVAPILRALTSFEVWQICRKSWRHKQNSVALIAQGLGELLSIDLDAHATPLTDLFEPNHPNPQHYDGFVLDAARVQRAWGKCGFVDAISLLPVFLRVAGNKALGLNEAVKALQAQLPPVCPAGGLAEETIARALGIPYPLPLFRGYNIAQALLHPLSADRFDDASDTTVPAFLDLADGGAFEAQLHSYVRACYAERYAADVAAKTLREKKALLAEFITQVCKAPSYGDLVRLLREGVTRGPCKVQMVNAASYGFGELKDTVLNLDTPVASRADAVRLLLLARDHTDPDPASNVVYNAGNVLFQPHLHAWRTVFLASLAPVVATAAAGDHPDMQALGRAQAAWDELEVEYRGRNRHVYREPALPNRAGHSNAKPSFFALGFQTLAHFAAAVSNEEWEAYRKVHVNCCGMKQLASYGAAGSGSGSSIAMSGAEVAAKVAENAAAKKAEKAREKQERQDKNRGRKARQARVHAAAAAASSSSSKGKKK